MRPELLCPSPARTTSPLMFFQQALDVPSWRCCCPHRLLPSMLTRPHPGPTTHGSCGVFCPHGAPSDPRVQDRSSRLGSWILRTGSGRVQDRSSRLRSRILRVRGSEAGTSAIASNNFWIPHHIYVTFFLMVWTRLSLKA